MILSVSPSINLVNCKEQSLMQKALCVMMPTVVDLEPPDSCIIVPNLNGYETDEEVSGHSGAGCQCPGSSAAFRTRAGRSSSWHTIAFSTRSGNNQQFMGGTGGGTCHQNAPSPRGWFSGFSLIYKYCVCGDVWGYLPNEWQRKCFGCKWRKGQFRPI